MDHRLILFPKDINSTLEKDTLEQTLIAHEVIAKNPAYLQERYSEEFQYLLTPKFIDLIDTDPYPPSEYYSHVNLWIQQESAFTILGGVDLCEASPKNPETGRVLGDNDMLMRLLEKLVHNPNAVYRDRRTDTNWYIRDLDFSNTLAFGTIFIMISLRFPPKQELLDSLNSIVGEELRYCFYSM